MAGKNTPCGKKKKTIYRNTKEYEDDREIKYRNG